MVVARYETIRWSKNNDPLGISEKDRDRIISKEKLGSAGTTITDLPEAVLMLFPDSIFDGNGDYPFSEAVVHENIHGVGVGDNSWHPLYVGPPYGHDLYGMTGYSEIIKACKR